MCELITRWSRWPAGLVNHWWDPLLFVARCRDDTQQDQAFCAHHATARSARATVHTGGAAGSSYHGCLAGKALASERSAPRSNAATKCAPPVAGHCRLRGCDTARPQMLLRHAFARGHILFLQVQVTAILAAFCIPGRIDFSQRQSASAFSPSLTTSRPRCSLLSVTGYQGSEHVWGLLDTHDTTDIPGKVITTACLL